MTWGMPVSRAALAAVSAAVGRPDPLVDEVLEELLAPGRRRRIELTGGNPCLEALERLGTAENRRPERPVPAGIARLATLLERSPLDHVGRHEQRPRKRVDAADVAVEQVVSGEALAP